MAFAPRLAAGGLALIVGGAHLVDRGRAPPRIATRIWASSAGPIRLPRSGAIRQGLRARRAPAKSLFFAGVAFTERCPSYRSATSRPRRLREARNS